VLVVGGGYVGMYTALRLRRKLKAGEARVTVVEPRGYMTYQPFLPEAAAGSVEPRHVVVPLRRVLRGVEVLNGRITAVDHSARQATFTPVEGDVRTLHYDHIVVAPGSIARTLPIPGLAAYGIGFKQVEEAIALRNHVLSRLDIAASSEDSQLRRRSLGFVFVGGGYAGIEALAELEDMARYAMRFYPHLDADEMRWTLVEASGRILPEVGEDMGRYTVRELQRRGIDVRLESRLAEVDAHEARLEDGTVLPCHTLVWTAGVKAHPMLAATDLPLDEKGRVRCDAMMRVEGVDGAWAAGDCAAVPDLTKPAGALCSPSAQHAVRQARRLGDNIVAVLRGLPPTPYKHAHAGSVASLGLHKGVAQVYGVKLRGFPAWFMHRTYHVSRVPTTNRKARVVADWTLALFFRREVVSLGRLQDPRREFQQATEGHDGPGLSTHRQIG
jgi:NADH:quinone reductase (non-electrogenic)